MLGKCHTHGVPILPSTYKVSYKCVTPKKIGSRIRMVVARASGTLIAPSLKQNTFLTLELRPAGGGLGAPASPGQRLLIR